MQGAPPVPRSRAGSTKRFAFAPESRGDPLGSYPSIRLDGLAFNLWLTERVLEPVLARWRRAAAGDPGLAEAVSHDVEWASERCRRAFQEILPAAALLGDPALLAAMSVAANLQRTLGILAELLLDGGKFSLDREAGPAPATGFRLSRFWCGLIDHAENRPYFAGRVREPVHPARLHPRRRDPRHLANAFWSSVGEIEAQCAQALEALRAGILESGLFSLEDLRHLHGDAVPPRYRGEAR